MEALLRLLAKPGRYLGTEVHAVRKPAGSVTLRVALAVPDLYEVGMGEVVHLGLYHLLNARVDVAAERVYLPGPDLEARLVAQGDLLRSLETRTLIREFDLLAFQLTAPLQAVNVPAMLARAGLAPLARDRQEGPLVLGLLGATFPNPEPLADLCDLVLLGEPEAIFPTLCDGLGSARARGDRRGALLEAATAMPGVYLPVQERMAGRHPIADPAWLGARAIANLEQAVVPTQPLLPHIKLLRDALPVELARGCGGPCLLCPGGLTSSVRERSPETLLAILDAQVAATGWEAVGLLAGCGGYTQWAGLLPELCAWAEGAKVTLSLPPLRPGSLDPNLLQGLSRLPRGRLTIALDAASSGLRARLGRPVDERWLTEAARAATQAGWRTLALAVRLGLPGERREDLEELLGLAVRVREGARGEAPPHVTVTGTLFQPLPMTPLQWEGLPPADELSRTLGGLRKALKRRGIGLTTGVLEQAYLEAGLRRGDRRLTRGLIELARAGVRHDGLSAPASLALWREAVRAQGVDLEALASEGLDPKAPLPWAHLDGEVPLAALQEAHGRYLAGEPPNEEAPKPGGAGAGQEPQQRDSTAGLAPPARRAPLPGRPGVERQAPRAWVKPRPPAPCRIRSGFSKLGAGQYLGHLDLMAALARAARRAGLPLSYSQALHPLPRLTLSTAIPVGVESLSEFVEWEFDRYVDPDLLTARLNEVLPEGIRIQHSRILPLRVEPLPARVRGGRYVVRLGDLRPVPARERAEAAVAAFRAAKEFPIEVTRKDRVRKVDLRPLIRSMTLHEDLALEFTLEPPPEGGAKPAEVVEALLGLKEDEVRSLRILKTETLLH
ncbi:MAG: DUF2344 domain-containing protein [Deltaproteobacteria bacterium]|nr:DUF2344 domain-containing protein [Deltaproteobacteria bacterium]